MNDADTFDRAASDWGGRLDTASLHPDAVAEFDHVATRARGFLQSAAVALPEMPPIYFDFLDNWDYNAAAIWDDGRYFIGFTRGTVATVGVLFDRMLADPQVLPFIGTPEEEVADLPLLPDVGSDLVRLVASEPTFPRPRNWARQMTARRLTELALDFLVAHEFAHIANGHLDYYINANQGSFAMNEVGGATWAPRNSESALMKQTMEMDADGTAVLLSLVSEWRRVTGLNPRPGPEWNDVYSRPGMVSLQWSWAVYSLFRLFGDVRLTHEDEMKDDHPSPRLRSVMIHQAAERVPRPQGLHTHPAFIGDNQHQIPAIKAGQLDVEHIFSQLTGKPEATEGLDDAWGDIGKAKIDRLQNYWQTKLKGELTTFACQPLRDYADPGEEATTQ